MKTKEVEIKTGLTKQTIFYYEKEGLIHPIKDDNGYRHYCDEDIQLLLLIKLLRNMNVGIDDIRMMINQELSFQDILDNQSCYLEKTIKDVQNVKQEIDFYKEKKVPLIPALQEIEKVDEKSILGFQKTKPNVSIGRRPTKKFMIKKIIYQMIFALSIGWCCWEGVYRIYDIKNIYIFIGMTISFIILQIIAFGLGLGELGGFTIQNNACLFVKFDEYGINYADVNSFSKRIKYARDILRNQDVLKHIDYEDIKSVQLQHTIRYMKIPGTNLPTRVQVTDFYFTFHDQTKYALIQPMFLDHDREIAEMILKEKVKNIEDITKGQLGAA